MKSTITALFTIVGLVALFGIMALYHGFVLATLWSWFVTPLGVAKIGLAHAYGLSLIPAVILGTRGLYTPKEERIGMLVQAVLIPLVALLFGWIAVGFM